MSWVKWVLGLAALAGIGYVIWPANQGVDHSPAAVNANKSMSRGESLDEGGSNFGISDATVPKSSELNDVQVSQELKSEFVYGYILMGLRNGKVIYRPYLTEIQVSADWDHAILAFSTEGNWGYVYIPGLAIVNPKKHAKLEPTDVEENFPLQFPDPYRLKIATNPDLPCAFVKMLDRENETLLIGFTSCP